MFYFIGGVVDVTRAVYVPRLLEFEILVRLRPQCREMCRMVWIRVSGRGIVQDEVIIFVV